MSLYPYSPNLVPYDPSTWGTSVPLGTRMGTTSPDQSSATFLRDVTSVPYTVNNVQLATYFDQFGPGMFQSPYFTYRIRPGSSLDNDILPTPDIASLNLADADIDTIVSVPLLGSTIDNCGAVLITNSDGTNYLQLDVPRSVAVWLDGAQITGDEVFKLWIYGTDFYGLPKTYLAKPILPTTTSDGLLYETPSCFYTITAIQYALVGGSGGNGTVNLLTGFNFGLPYRLDQIPHVIGYSQGDLILSSSTNVESSYLFPLAYVVQGSPPPALGAVIPWGLGLPVACVNYNATTNNVTTGLGTGSDYTEAQSITSVDTRGWVHPNMWSDWSTTNPATGDIVITDLSPAANFPDGSTLTVTYYVAGADMFQQQVEVMRNTWYAAQGQSGQYGNTPIISNLGYQQFITRSNQTTSGGVPDPLNVLALKGAIPYYEPPSAANIDS